MEKNTKKRKILAIETSGKTCGAALADDAGSVQLRGEVFFDIGLRHSEILKNCCAFLLDQAGWKKEELTHLAVSTGPGSFTGLRVGISFARALSQALKIPLIGITTFDIMAAQAREFAPEEALCIGFESIGQDLFVGFFERGKVKPRSFYEVLALSQVVERLRRAPASCLGDGIVKHRNELESALDGKLKILPAPLMHPRAGMLARLALDPSRSKRISRNSWKDVTPFYMRPPLAVERLGKGSKR